MNYHVVDSLMNGLCGISEMKAVGLSPGSTQPLQTRLRSCIAYKRVGI